ncbi:RHS repeat domain-containing protein [Lacrimispora sp.]|uniref:RHS repeat domain-containing protein n=1 Tax=Lacrimispora sp. TaxID=2719234 RepID=UPI0028B1326A|nr:RHS repeat-associated core domain-containing protein [Lacrimispora sp.]
MYDARNRLTDTYQYLSPGNWIKTTCRYDAMNQVILRRTGDTPSGEGREVIKYTNDRFGNVTAMTDARGCTEYYEYDKAGRLQKKTDRNKDQTVYQNDALERLIKETVQKRTPDGMAVSEREYAYGKNGKRIREVSREFVGGKQTLLLETKYRYNHRGQLTRQEDPENVVKDYTYDIYGNCQSFQLIFEGKASPDVSLYYVYDDLYRLKQVRKSNAAGVILAEYEYDEKGNRKTLRYPQSGIESIYQYNDGNQIISLENKRQGTVISAWEYDYDVDGNILSKINKAGSVPVTISYQYDRLGRLTEEDYSGWKRTLYTYDAYSNRVKMMVEGRTKDELVSVTSYEYGLNNRLEKEIKKQGKTTETYRYRYDDNGNETFRIWEKTSPTPDYPGNVKLSGYYQMETPTVYEWRHYDGFNQLIRINQDDKEITYQYRGDGLRHSAQVRKLTESQGKTNLYCWDGGDIVAEQTDGGKIKTYLRGINLVASEIDRVVCYYILNEHGDVIHLWSQSGACKASYEYDAFGVERNLDKKDENPFRYCGECLDLETNTYYLRARNYRSVTGRFTSEDTLRCVKNQLPNKQEVSDPLSLNLYTYCHSNPVMYIDSSGLSPTTYQEDNGMYGFLPDYKFINVVTTAFGIVPIPFFDKGFQWGIDKATGTKPINSNDIASVVMSTLSDSTTVVSMLEYLKYLGYSSDALDALKSTGKVFGVVGNVLTGIDVVTTWADNSPHTNQITFQMFSTSMESNSREGVIFKYAIYSNIVSELMKNGGVTYDLDWGVVTNLKVNWDIYDKTVKNMGIDTQKIRDLYR